MLDNCKYQLVPCHQYPGLPNSAGAPATVTRIGTPLEHSCLAPPWRYPVVNPPGIVNTSFNMHAQLGKPAQGGCSTNRPPGPPIGWPFTHPMHVLVLNAVH